MQMTDYQCQTCKVIEIVEDNESWYARLKKHREGHLGTKWGPSYEFCRFTYWHPRCVRTNCGEVGTHHVRSEYFGMSYCDKHWNERNTEHERRLLRA